MSVQQHIVHIFAVENEAPLTTKVVAEHRFWLKEGAIKWAEGFNKVYATTEEESQKYVAEYVGSDDLI
jgi:hypothetical protein